ncbi:hypothetical protein DWW36_04830 [Erysipelotrichaceae bacterium AF15-26LB]|nr:hypothetical protein [[Clostridium] innocuum]RJV91042.1 hypothetical protein DWX45_07330 [Erysipelotrichaceae bacterium AF19-24AC]RJV91211.1 hypothetical protein DWW36_04830 [Erysipelotrichaceae bacterium AF15-26LB]
MRKRFFSAGLLTALLLMGCSSKPVLKAKEIEVSVHKELDLSASCFFDSAGKSDKVTVKSGNLDIQKLGTYAITIAYEKETYDVKVKVVDKEKPVLKWKKDKLIFKTGTDADKVNSAIRENAVITDNYDKSFQDLPDMKNLPKTEKEIIYDVQVKDSSGNVSDKSTLILQFTSDGKKKENLKQERTSVSITVEKNTAKSEEKKTKTASKKDTKKKDGKSSDSAASNKEGKATESKVEETAKNNDSSAPSKQENSNSQSSAEKKPKPDANTGGSSGNTAEPEPVYPPEEKLPVMTVDNFPSNLLGNSGRAFSTYDEAYAWANEQVKTEGSPWYGYYMEIGQPFDGNYANAGDGSTPWTVEFFK